MNEASLIVTGKDRPGIVAAVSSVLSRHDANVVSLNQYSDDPYGGAFFQRTVFCLENLKAALPAIRADLESELAKGFALEFTLRDMSVPKRVAIFASKSDHCLLDLLWRHRRAPDHAARTPNPAHGAGRSCSRRPASALTGVDSHHRVLSDQQVVLDPLPVALVLRTLLRSATRLRALLGGPSSRRPPSSCSVPSLGGRRCVGRHRRGGCVHSRPASSPQRRPV